jgi:peptidylprolyl isomerase
MNGLRQGLVAAVILAGTLLTAAAQPGSPEPLAVPIRSGNHPDFGRVVFDAPPHVAYRVTRDGDRVTVRFADTVRLGAAPAVPRNVLSIHANAAQAELIVAAGASLHESRLGDRVVLDVFDPVANHAILAPAAAGQPEAAVLAPPASQAAPPASQAAPPASQAAPPAPQALPPAPQAAPPARHALPPAPKPGSAAIAAAPLAPAEQPARAPRAEPPARAAAPVAVEPPVPASQANPPPPAGNGSVAPVGQRAAVPQAAKGAALAPPSLPAGGANGPADIVAQRGDIKLTAADIRDMLDHADPAQRAQVQASQAALVDFVRDRLLRQTLLAEAHAAKWDQDADVIARANDARDTVIVQTYLASRTPPDPDYPSQADIIATYEANKDRFAMPKQYHVAQIVLLVPAGAAQEVDEAAHRRAQELRQQALDPEGDFAELADKNSQDRATAGQGGDLGWVREDQLAAALREVVTKLPDNAISEPVRSAEAWHVVKLLGTRPPSVLPLEQVRDALVLALRQTRAQQGARAYVEELLRKQPIQLDESELAHRVAAPR